MEDLKKIVADNIVDNLSEEVTPEDVRNVFNPFADGIYENQTNLAEEEKTRLAEVKELNLSVKNLDSKIDSESEERVNADKKLDGRIDKVNEGLTAEEKARLSEDKKLDLSVKKLDSKIDTETKARVNADSNLNNLIGKNGESIEGAKKLLNKEVDERKKADERLTESIADNNKAITAEEKARKAEDSKLQGEIDNCFKINEDDPSKRPLHELFINIPHVVYNQVTKFYEMSNLTDITYEQMIEIYQHGKDWLYQQDQIYRFFPLRAIIVPIANTAQPELYIHPTCFVVSEVETINFQQGYNSFYVKTLDRRKLENLLDNHYCREFIGINLENQNFKTIIQGAVLEKMKIINVNADLDCDECPVLNNESILFTIQNETASIPITIKLHADAYARATADSAIQTALTEHPNVTLIM